METTLVIDWIKTIFISSIYSKTERLSDLIKLFGSHQLS